MLNENLGKESQSAIAKVWARSRNWEIDYALTLLRAFQKGITK